MNAPPFTPTQDRGLPLATASAASEPPFEWGLYYEPTTGATIASNNEGKKLFGTDVYAITKPTSNASHSTQVIDLTFFVSDYGYGDLNIGLDFSTDDGVTKKTLLNQIWAARQGMATRRPGVGTVSFTVQNMPTDGTTMRIYPTIQSNFSEAGRVEISWGPYDSGFTAERGFVKIHGRALPTTWRSDAPVQYPLLTPTAATASHSESSNTPDKTIDLDYSTRWSNNGDSLDPNGWLVIDFGATKTFRHVYISWEGAYPSQYKIQVSADSTNWTDSVTVNKTNKNPDNIYLSTNNSGRYLRILGQTMATGYQMSIYQIEIRGE